MNETISYFQIRAALRALGIGNIEEVSSILVTRKQLSVYRHDLKDGKPYLDPVTDHLAVIEETFDIDEEAAADTDGSGLAYATVTLVHRNGVTYDMRVEDDTEYLANISNVLVDVDKPFGGNGEAAQWDHTPATMIDLHLYGKGIASQTIAAA